MTCPAWEEKLNAFIDEEIESLEKMELLDHLADCDSCRREKDLLLHLKRSVQVALPCPEVPPDLSAEIVKALKNRSESQRPTGWAPLRSARPRDNPRKWRVQNPLKSARPFSFGIGLAFALAFLIVGYHLLQKPRAQNEISLDWILAAHNEYAMSLPLAPQELALPQIDLRAKGVGG